MKPLDLHRAGLPVTLSDKLRMIASLEELNGFADQLVADRAEVSKDDWAMIARMRVEFQRQKLHQARP
jgi:hypothetical protein